MIRNFCCLNPEKYHSTLPVPLVHVLATDSGVQQKSVSLLLLFSFLSVEIAELAFIFACRVKQLFLWLQSV